MRILRLGPVLVGELPLLYTGRRDDPAGGRLDREAEPEAQDPLDQIAGVLRVGLDRRVAAPALARLDARHAALGDVEVVLAQVVRVRAVGADPVRILRE